MISRLSAPLRRAPATLPALVTVALLIVWATDQAGYPVTHWAPGAIVVVGLLGVATGVLGVRAREVPRAVLIALACLAAYTALSFLSILWAAVPSDAWEGADRTLLYLLVFALLALWPQRGQTAALVLAAWTLALAGLAAFVALHVDAASFGGLATMLPGGRLIYPSGYANANAAQWLMALWPALLLARSERLPWALRGSLAGAAVVLAGVALLSQSRGSLYATPVMLVLVFALLPGRVRTFLVLIPVAGGIAAAAPAVLEVGNDRPRGAVVPGNLHHATLAIFAAALVVALVVAAGAAFESRRLPAEPTRRRLHRVVGIVAIAALIATVAGGWAAAGDPAARVGHAWDTFKSPRGYAANASGGRLLSGLGSSRYDFYRVALDEFAAHPIAGIGADNFAQQYLARRHSNETPHYPHSVEFRVLSQTGLIGSLLALAFLIAALVAGAAAAGVRRRGRGDPLARAVAAAALAGFAYWLVHGSFDWFFEFAGLGAPAFALLGLACALAPRNASADAPRPHEPPSEGAEESRPVVRRRSLSGRLAWALGAALALLAAASFAAPWLSGLGVGSAARIWPSRPLQAYSQLDDAARLNPLSAEPYLVAGSIALRFGDLARADREFSRALSRVPDDAYATLERGAIASSTGDRRLALVMLERALRLDPRDALTRDAVRVVRRGGRVDVAELNRAILLKAERLS
jgi:tetratricopeptide (TPR) repeat protein